MQNLITNLSNTINSYLHIPITSKEITIKEIKNDSGCKKVILKSTSNEYAKFNF
jgi:hypothetical protein